MACALEIAPDTHGGDKDFALIIFRVVQEATTNILRHAEAGNVAVTLKERGRHLGLKVEDNRKGIFEDEAPNAKSLGIPMIQDRASFCGERLQCDGKPGRDTIMKVLMPVGRRKRNSSPEDFEIGKGGW